MVGLLKKNQHCDVSMPTPERKTGFTLIELSIVLVIVGLIVGGVMVGRDLIEAGKIRSQITQISDIETQINTFKLKYNCLPGDCANATDIIGATYAKYTIRNGNGDGLIRGIYSNGIARTEAMECTNANISEEVPQLLLQLNATGLGKYTASDLTNGVAALVGREYQAVAYGNGSGLFVSCLSSVAHPTWVPAFFNSGNIIVVGAGTNSFGYVGYATGSYGQHFWGIYGYHTAILAVDQIGIPNNVVRQIDDKIDDGKPNNGKFGIISGDVGCDDSVTAYTNPDIFCRVTAGKRIN